MSGNIYEDILRAQVKQGNFGGKSGPLGFLANKTKSKPKSSKPSKPKKDTSKEGYEWIKINLISGVVNEATDSNGLSDPFVKFGRLNPSLFEGKYLFQSPVQKKTLTPQWNWTQTSHLEYLGKHRYLIVELWDEDPLRNDFIGGTTIDLGLHCNKLSKNYVTEVDIPIYKDFDETTRTGKQAGTIKIGFSVTYDPNSKISNFSSC